MIFQSDHVSVSYGKQEWSILAKSANFSYLFGAQQDVVASLVHDRQTSEVYMFWSILLWFWKIMVSQCSNYDVVYNEITLRRTAFYAIRTLYHDLEF